MRQPACMVLLAAACLSAACAGRRAVPQPFPGAAPPPGAARAEPADAPAPPRTVLEPAADRAERPAAAPAIIATALALRGVPYRNGGSDTAGFDCSGFVQYVFAQHGVAMPREVRDQFKQGTPVKRDQLRPGDLVFFETVSKGASHVGIALGGDEFVHAPSSRGVVRVEKLTTSYWASRWVGARRIEPRGCRTCESGG